MAFAAAVRPLGDAPVGEGAPSVRTAACSFTGNCTTPLATWPPACSSMPAPAGTVVTLSPGSWASRSSRGSSATRTSTTPTGCAGTGHALARRRPRDQAWRSVCERHEQVYPWPGTWRPGRCCLERPRAPVEAPGPAVRVQPGRRSGTVRTPTRQRAQRRWPGGRASARAGSLRGRGLGLRHPDQGQPDAPREGRLAAGLLASRSSYDTPRGNQPGSRMP